jgi:uncharacterized RDD family membrane protein YckC
MRDEVSEPLYGTFARRIRALVLDGIVLTIALLLVVLLASTMELGRTARLALFWGLIGLAIMYEPALVAFRGYTVGQQLSNLRVVAPTPSGRLPLWKAFLRWLLKAVTGLGSFATMGATRRNQALHDLPFGTTVQIANPSLAKERDFITERREVTAGRLPSRTRRVVVIAGYLILFAFLVGPIMSLGASSDCVDLSRCAPGERLWTDIVATAWMAASIAVGIFGWKARLFGARRRAVVPDSPGTAT